MDVRKLLNLPHVLDVKKVICVQPHPDDNEIGMAGTLLELADRGCEIVFVTVTDGRSGVYDENRQSQDIVKIRSREQVEAGKIIGVSRQVNLDFPDAGNYGEDEVFHKLIVAFRKLQPDIVFTVDPWTPYEIHPDHIKTGRAAARAVLFSNNQILFSDVEPVLIPQVGFYATSYPNTFIDVTKHWDLKLAAISAHKSQFDNPEGEMVKAYLSYEGQQLYEKHVEPLNDIGFAEAFKILAVQQLHFFPNAIYS